MSIISCTSPSPSARILPASSETSRPRSRLCCAQRLAERRTNSPRCGAGTSRQRVKRPLRGADDRSTSACVAVVAPREHAAVDRRMFVDRRARAEPLAGKDAGIASPRARAARRLRPPLFIDASSHADLRGCIVCQAASSADPYHVDRPTGSRGTRRACTDSCFTNPLRRTAHAQTTRAPRTMPAAVVSWIADSRRPCTVSPWIFLHEAALHQLAAARADSADVEDRPRRDPSAALPDRRSA